MVRDIAVSTAEYLEPFGTSIAVAVALLAIVPLRLVARQRHIVRALNAILIYLLLFLALRIGLVFLPEGLRIDEDGDPTRLVRAFGGVGLALILLAAVRVVPLIAFDYLLARRQKRTTPRILRDVVIAALYVLAAFILLGAAFPNINLGSLVATAGVASLVVGLALQDTLGNVFAGLALQAERPFEPGDWITVGTTTGRVLEVDWRATKVIDFDEDVLVIPNSVIGRTELVNHSRPRNHTGQAVKLGVSVTAPPSRVIEVLEDVLRKTPGVLPEPRPWARLIDLHEHEATYLLKFFTPGFEQSHSIQSRVRKGVWYALERSGIPIPSPMRTIQTLPPRANDPDAAVARIASELGQIEFLSELGPGDLRVAAAQTRALRYGAGETIIQEGETGSEAYFVVEGTLRVCYTDGRGDLQTVATLSRGDHFGEMSALSGEPRTSTVVADTDVKLLVQDRETFRDLLRQHPGVAARLSEMLERRREEIGSRRAGHGDGEGDAQERPLPILSRLRSLLGLA